MEEGEVLELPENIFILDETQYSAIIEKVDAVNNNLVALDNRVQHLTSFLAFLCIFSAYGILCRIRRKGVGR